MVRLLISLLAAALLLPIAAIAQTDVSRTESRGAKTLRFSGNGGKTLAPIRVTSPSTMIWTNDGAIFQIFNSGASTKGTVNSQAKRGTSYVPAGRYPLQVNAIGNWTLVIKPGIERVSNPIRFVGNGGKALPPFRLTSRKTMYWTSTGALFQTFASGATIDGTVNSQARRGTTSLPAGKYELYVNAVANWTISIK
jgi:hypothetical protein